MNKFSLYLEDLMDLYESIKREKKIYGYSVEKKTFIRITDTVRKKINDGELAIIPFIDCYSVCLEIIELYLNREDILKYKAGAISEMKKNRHNKIVAFLWYFEHIDGAYGFGEFEEQILETILKKWAKEANILLVNRKDR